MQASKRVCCYPKPQCSGYQRPIRGRHPHTVFSSRAHILNRDDARSSWRCKELPRQQRTSVHSYDGLALLHRDSMKLLAEVYKVQMEVAWCVKRQDSGLSKRWQI
jgi:hypothetical protein